MRFGRILSACLASVFLLAGFSQTYAQEAVSNRPPGIKAFLSGTTYYLNGMWTRIHNEEKFEPVVVEDLQEADITMAMLFDPVNIAMKVESGDRAIREWQVWSTWTVTGNRVSGFSRTQNKTEKREKTMPMYYDNQGYVYSYVKKQGYVKVLFSRFMKKMSSAGTGMPSSQFIFGTVKHNFPDWFGKEISSTGKLTYNGIDISPRAFPILEWAFAYKPQYFEGKNGFGKETVKCAKDPGCTKFTKKAGDGAGSYVLFDSKGRLAEIHTPENGYAVYTYDEKITVELPDAIDMTKFF